MSEKWYDEGGFDVDGFDENGRNRYGEVKPAKAFQNLASEDVKAVCSTEAGRRFIWRLISICKVFDDFEPMQLDKEDQKQIGRRSVGLQILAIIQEVDKDMFFTMMKENHTREREQDYARAKYK